MVSSATHVQITGRVQGVGYRIWLERTAEVLDLGGWVRNRYDGSVEAVLAGSSSAIEQAIVLMKHGPQDARVDDVSVRPAEAAETALMLPDGFTVISDV